MSDGVVLVAGGAGYVGSHACKALAQAGWTPVVFDNLSRGFREAVKFGPFVHGDILDRAALDRAFRQWKPQAVMHFAALAYVGESVTQPDLYYRVNVAGSLSLLETMRDHGVSSLIFSSTCATYGVPQALPIVESAPQAPINPYGASKLMVERMIADFGAAYGLRGCALRYFNAAGADPEGEIGENHDPETHLIPLAIDAALGLGPELVIYGEDYPTPDGSCVRDYIHVADLADAHVKALTRLVGGGDGLFCNLAVGRGYSVKEIVAAVTTAAGVAPPHRFGPRRPGDPPELVADPRLAQRALGWTPAHSSLEEIIATAMAWRRKRVGLSNR